MSVQQLGLSNSFIRETKPSVRVKNNFSILNLSAVSPLPLVTVLLIAGFTSVAQQPKFAGLSSEEAAREMILPPGFKATLFAGEPDVQQPIAFAIDDRGRLWVAESYTYPNRVGKPPAQTSPIRPISPTATNPTPDQRQQRRAVSQ